MKKLNFSIFFAFLLVISVITGCDKKEDPEPEPETPYKQNDQAASSELDEALSHVNDLISNKVGSNPNARVAAYSLPCGVVSVDSSTTSGGYKVYKINYGNHTSCALNPYKYKSGEVSFKLENGTTFGDVGAIFSVTLTNYAVEILSSGNTITLNGTVRVTNVDGGHIWQAVTNAQTIRHRIRGTITITYANTQVRTRSFFQLRTWTATTPSDWASLSLSIAGDTNITTPVAYTNVSEIGKTYEGDYDFKTELLTAFSWSNCGSTYAGPYVLKTGQARMNVTIPLISPTYIQVDGGYYWDYNNTSSTPTVVNNCTSNAYKITTVIGASIATTYQLY